MSKHSEVRELAKQFYRDPDGKRLIDYIVHDVCGVGSAVTGISDQALAMNAGSHNAGVAILEMTMEQE